MLQVHSCMQKLCAQAICMTGNLQGTPVSEQLHAADRHSMRQGTKAVTGVPSLCKLKMHRHNRISAAQVLAGGQPEQTNVFLQLLAQAAVAPSAAAGGSLRGPQHHLPMHPPPRGPPAHPLPAAEAGQAAPASVREFREGEEARDASASDKVRRPEFARRGPPPAGGQGTAPNQARGSMQGLPPLFPPAQGLEGGFPGERAEGYWQGGGAAERRRGAAAPSKGLNDDASAGDAVRQGPDDLAEASALVRAVSQARLQPCQGLIQGLAVCTGSRHVQAVQRWNLLVLHAALACHRMHVRSLGPL